jgi:hypothetical protein
MTVLPAATNSAAYCPPQAAAITAGANYVLYIQDLFNSRLSTADDAISTVAQATMAV